tara:strand:+ start:4338 stop:5453 length:1116 start_codon:yes stop_codon:yes gene_type:complete
MAQVGDYDIPNASGATVRSELNQILDAIKSCNSGSSNPAGTVEFMLYGDTSDKILKVFSTTNSQFTEIGNIDQANLGLLPKSGTTAMSGGLQLISGASNNLALKFADDTDTGLFRQDSGSMGIVSNTEEVARINANGLQIRKGKSLQIYNSGNTKRIDIDFAGSNDLNFALPTADGSAGSFMKTDGSGQLSFAAVAGVPRGAVFCMATSTVPDGYLECNGDSIPNGNGTVQGKTADFSALRALIGATLPDLRGEFVRGWASDTNDSTRDQGRGILTGQSDDITSHNHAGSSTSSVTDPGHFHNLLYDNGSFGGSSGAVTPRGSNTPSNPGISNRISTKTTGISVSTSTTIGNTGGSETRPRNVALMYIIKF